MAINFYTSHLLLCLALTILTFHATSNIAAPRTRHLFWWQNPANRLYVPIFRDGYTKLAANTTEDMSKCRFYLFTRENPTRGQELIAGSMDSITRSNYIRGAPVKILAHGFISRMETDYPWLARQGYLSLGQDVNIILVDWQWLANGPAYDLAARNTKPVGEKTAVLIAYLLEQGLVSIDKIHVQGMSLGSHVAGSAGRHLFELTGMKVPRITGNDPAGPFFEDQPVEWRLDPTDADFVDAVHTDGELLGFGITLVSGHVDFYPNGGERQPGCLTDVCDHARAVYYNAESITSAVKFRACKCESWQHFTSGSCGCQVTADMGEPCSTQAQHGKYYLHTNSKSPFAQG